MLRETTSAPVVPLRPRTTHVAGRVLATVTVLTIPEARQQEKLLAAPGYDGWVHAIQPTRARRALAADHVPVHQALCDQLAAVTPTLGPWDRTAWPAQDLACPPCAWIVAIERSLLGRELEILTPPQEDDAWFARAGIDRLLARRVCEAIIGQAAGPLRTIYDLRHPHTIKLLAAASLHAPVIAVDQLCREQRCAHEPASCQAHALCPTCSLDRDFLERVDVSPGSLADLFPGGVPDSALPSCQQQYLPECTIDAPCQVLATIAASYGVAAGVTGGC